MSTEQSSLEKALVAEGGSIREFQYLPDPDQLDLLRDEQGNLPKDALRQLREKRRGRGRPEGAGNKANKQIAKYFIERYGHPLDVLGEIINTPTDALVEQLKLAQGGEAKHKPVRAMDAALFRLKAVDIALPYIIGKQPVQVQMSGKADVILNIPGLTDAAHLAEFVDAPELTEAGLSQLEYVPDSFGQDAVDAEIEEIAEAGDAD